MSATPTLADIEAIKLHDGRTLTAQQTLACVLWATEDLTYDQIAAESGYSSGKACSRFLRSELGREGGRVALVLRTVDGARVGMETLTKLATGAKSEGIRLEAAMKLLEIARLQGATGGGPAGPAAQGVSVNINLGERRDDTVTIDQ